VAEKIANSYYRTPTAFYDECLSVFERATDSPLASVEAGARWSLSVQVKEMFLEL
jgi:hypothetical protein